jgi:hypothetical protein
MKVEMQLILFTPTSPPPPEFFKIREHLSLIHTSITSHSFVCLLITEFTTSKFYFNDQHRRFELLSQMIIIKWIVSNDTRLDRLRVCVYRVEWSIAAAFYVLRMATVARLDYFRRTVRQVPSVP